MAELAVITKDLDFHLEQVQDFTPTPMTVSTEAWYSGYDPYTLEPVFCARTPREKQAQRQFFFWYKPEERRNIEHELRRIGRPDLIAKLYNGRGYSNRHTTYDDRAIGSRPEMPKRQGDRRQGNKKASYNPNFNHANRRQKKSGDVRGHHRRNS